MNEAIRRKGIQRCHQISQLESKLKNDLTFFPDKGQKIIETSTEELWKKLQDGEITAVAVLKAFQWKAIEVTKKINCITEFIPEAEEWAEASDRIPAEDRGALHGIPASVKECINIRGMDTTIGLAKHLYKPVSSHAAIVKALISNGAVPFCKTNLPQTMLSFSCSNPIYGLTINPHDPSRTPGGSSGGEGALISSGGSILGIGTDVGGSGRVPCAFSGCNGFKPSSLRLTTQGVMKSKAGMTGICSSPTIMARDMFMIETCMRALTKDYQLHNMDNAVIPMLWNVSIFTEKRKLTFGYYEDLEFFRCTPGVKRAVKEAKLALEKAGHTVVNFDFFGDTLKTFEQIASLAFADGGHAFVKHMEHELVDPCIQNLVTLCYCPKWTIQILKKILELKSKHLGLLLQVRYYSSNKLWLGLALREDYIRQFSNEVTRKKIDLLLTPSFPFPAPQHYTMAGLVQAGITNSIYNYCDFPSGIVQVTEETQDDQMLLEEEYPEDELHYRIVKQATKGATGLPIGVQIAGLRYQDELVCRGMAELETALKTCRASLV